jgi:hypothetical protein
MTIPDLKHEALDERRTALLEVMAETNIDWTKHDSPLDALLAHLDEHEPAVAAAIRYGLARTEVWCGPDYELSERTVAIGLTDYQLYRLAYPDPEDSHYDYDS